MTGLRIGWAAPWNERSAIASSAAEVARELAARGHEVTVLRTETGEAATLPPRPAPGAVLHLDAVDDDTLRDSFDVVAAHIGDHHGYHGAAIRRLEPLGMVGIFHDAFIANLVFGHFHQTGRPDALHQLTHDVYGEDGMRDGEPFWLDMEEMARRRPMLEWLARRCAGAVAHSGHYAERLRQACPGPVAVIPLAFVVPDLPPPPVAWDRITLATIGYANANRRIGEIIMAIGASAFLRGRCRLRVIGEAAPAERARLARLAATIGIEPPEFTGWVSDEDLRWQLRDVDAIACLRNPVLEGASASVILALASGRPTLVTNHGCYAEIPADTVLACRPEAEALDAMRHLEWLLTHPAEGAALGARGRAVALERHAPAAYADALMPLLEQVVADRPRREARRHLFSTLGSLGLGVEDPAARRAETVLAGMGLGGRGK
ncbi:MAG TPA: glycosyltransferase family 4 protein [Roseomonas sp.]|jgi:glycosyltransferase involved in cell wall biosynthesis